MRVLEYSLQTAFKSLWHEKWINVLTILSISISLLILTAFAVITINADSVLKHWSKSFGLVVYLNDGISKEGEETLKAFFEKDTDIVEITYISEDQAAQELRQILGANAQILDELRDNPLPSSFELKLRTEMLDPWSVKQKALEIGQLSGVDEVQYGEKWLASLNTVTNIMKISAAFLGAAIFVAIVFITYNTIRILFYRRNEEVETLKLLGATRSFIRLPFLLEGAFIGIVSGAISSLSLFGIQYMIAAKGEEILPSAKVIMVSLPLEAYLTVPVLGAFMSIIGCFIAVGKIKY